MNEFYEYLIEKTMSCVHQVDKDEIKTMNCVLVFGSNAFELTKTTINYVKQKNPDARIILVIHSKMFDGLKDIIDSIDCVIKTDIGYTEKIIEDISQKYELCEIDGVMFYTQIENDLGNINILEIVSKINDRDIVIYGLNKECEIFNYQNFRFYLKGLRLYKEINLFINESMGLLQ